MLTLNLVLKKKWFGMIASGEKREEYRELKPYWIKRMCFTHVAGHCHYSTSECASCFQQNISEYMVYPFDRVKFRLGYAKDAPTMTYEVASAHWGYGRPAWGADPEKMYFVIKLGKRIC